MWNPSKQVQGPTEPAVVIDIVLTCVAKLAEDTPTLTREDIDLSR